MSLLMSASLSNLKFCLTMDCMSTEQKKNSEGNKYFKTFNVRHVRNFKQTRSEKCFLPVLPTKSLQTKTKNSSDLTVLCSELYILAVFSHEIIMQSTVFNSFSDTLAKLLSCVCGGLHVLISLQPSGQKVL